jgi:hypothetical protein
LTRYRKLPGSRRGIFRGGSLWLAPDHLLAVRSMRFREEYKRFYLRDVQAIVIAAVPRFHVSTLEILIAVLWLSLWLGFRDSSPWAPIVLWTAALGAAGTWLYVSVACSCRCCICTAVSWDEIPSVYRSWTARRFLREVNPVISTLQGVLQGDWPEALETQHVGPPGNMPAQPGKGIAPPRTGLRVRTMITDLFIGTLLADAAVHAALLAYRSTALQWTGYTLNVVEVTVACAIFLQAHRKQIKPAMRRLAIATLMVLGGLYYARPLLAGLAESAKTQTRGHIVVSSGLISLPASRLFHQVEIGANVILAMAGLAILLMDRDEGPTA